MTEFYQELCNLLIRPTRQIYHTYDLGNPIISTFGKRQDFQIFTKKKNRLKCSFYRNFLDDKDDSIPMPTIIYLHSLNGSRLQFLANVEPLMKKGFSISTLDFAGCGLSDGTYVTLGAHQKWDVLELIKYINQTYNQQRFLIWGRSMGAVAAIKFYSLFQQQRKHFRQLRNLQILGLVLDSPFSSLNQLAVQIAKNRINIPQIVIKMAFFMIQNSIESKANFKTSQLQLQNDVKQIKCPTILITSKNDTLVPSQHSLFIFKNIQTQDKKLLYIESQHNSNRQEKDILKIYQFLQEKSNISNDNNSFLTGNVDKKVNLTRSISSKRRQNLTLSKQKNQRKTPEKNQIIPTKNPNFYFSHVGQQNHIKIDDFTNKSPQKDRKKQFSFGKIKFSKPNSENQILQRKNTEIYKKQVLENKMCYSADRQRVMFMKQINQSCAQNYSSLKRQNIDSPDINLIGLASIPERKLTHKDEIHTSSYKNIECLKTVKKIKRLQPQSDKQVKEEKQKQDILKSHMNIISAKLKKKSKKQMAQSFLPQQKIQLNEQTSQSSEKTLKRQNTVKSSTNLQFPNKNKSQVFESYKKPSFNQKPWTPSYASNRQILFSQQVKKPFTPQFPLNTSMRINQINQRRQASKEDILKMYSLYPINENSRGIKTTLNIKYRTDTKQRAFNKKSLTQSLGEEHQIIRPEFMSNKNILSSQAIQVRNQSGLNRNKKIIFSDSKIPFQKPAEMSIFLK